MEKSLLLAIDDNPENLFLLEQLVETHLHGCELVTASNAEQGLALVSSRAFDGALIDVQMPGTDGVSLCRLLKSQDATRRLPILLITAKGSTARMRAEALSAGADDFISRPIDNAELLARIQVMLRINQTDKSLIRARDALEVRVAERTAELEQTNRQLTAAIAEHQRTAEQLARRDRELSTRNRIADKFLTLQGDEVFAAVLDIVLEAMGSPFGMFGYIDEQGVFVCPSLTPEVWAQCRMKEKTTAFPPETWGESIWGRAIREKQPLVSNTRLHVPAGHIEMQRVLASPIIYQDKSIGLICISNRTSEYEPADVELLSTLCRKIAPILHARLQRDRHERQRDLAEHALREAHQELETRVQERTAELVQTNCRLQNEIADRRRAEEALRESSRLLERVFASTHLLLAYIDTDLKFIRVNRAFAEYHGRSPAEFAGEDCRPLFAGDDDSAIFKQVLDSGKSVSLESKRAISGGPGRAESYWDWSLQPIKGDSGQVEGLLLCLVDVTSRELAEHRAHQHQAELAHVSRLSTIGEMGTTIAHELNQPLCAILATAQASARLLKAAGIRAPEVQDAIEQISTQAKRAGDMIRHLREFSRRRPIHRSTIDMREVIHEARDLVAGEIRPENVKITTNLPESIPLVLGDTIQIEQVLVNLMRNGVEAMQDCSPAERHMKVTLSCPQPTLLEVTVRDSGRGLPAGETERIFEPFFSTKPEGMGIGLTISRSIIEAHGGRLWAESAAEGGAVFRFVLPLTPESQPVVR